MDGYSKGNNSYIDIIYRTVRFIHLVRDSTGAYFYGDEMLCACARCT